MYYFPFPTNKIAYADCVQSCAIMNQLARLFLSILLACLSFVHAKSEHSSQIMMYAFNSDDCYGPPAGANMELKQGQCYDISAGARSVKPVVDKKHAQWVNDVKNGGQSCALITYSLTGCPSDKIFNATSFPEYSHECVFAGKIHSGLSIFSVKFDCGSLAKKSSPL